MTRACCGIARHPDADAIATALETQSVRQVCVSFGISKSTLGDHRKHLIASGRLSDASGALSGRTPGDSVSESPSPPTLRGVSGERPEAGAVLSGDVSGAVRKASGKRPRKQAEPANSAGGGAAVPGVRGFPAGAPAGVVSGRGSPPPALATPTSRAISSPADDDEIGFDIPPIETLPDRTARVAWIEDIMLQLKWKRGKSSIDLAKAWNMNLNTVENYASEAWRGIKRAVDPEAVRQRLAVSLDRGVAMATVSTDGLKSLAGVARVYGEMVGALSGSKVQINIGQDPRVQEFLRMVFEVLKQHPQALADVRARLARERAVRELPGSVGDSE